METEEVIKLVDGIYKNILEKFNPGARQLISAGKAYLKALHGAAAASRLFNEALAKIAVNAQQGGTTDIGSALMNIVGVYKEIQDQHMNILKAFYVDLLVPLETNLEKDTKVVQFEQKKFLQQHKVRADSYSKATATMKKYKKKKTNSEKEIKSMQAVDEEKQKLDTFCEQSLKNAMTQERRRYGFVLERQCSLAKHWMAHHASGCSAIEGALENWNDIAATREFLPPNVENMFASKLREQQMIDDESDRGSIISALRKTRSIDASCLDMRSLGDVANSSMQMPRAKSEFNLTGSSSEVTNNWDRPVVRALYAYLSSGENQLSFLENDKIALVGDRAKGWQFGENLRTQKFGWFPIAYAESDRDDVSSVNDWGKLHPHNNTHHHHHHNNSNMGSNNHNSDIVELTPESSLDGTLIDESLSSKLNASYHEDASPTRMFGDTIQYRHSKQFRRVSRGDKPPKPGPPPQLPAPVPSPVVPGYNQSPGVSQSHSFSSNTAASSADKRKPSTMNYKKPPPPSKTSRNGVTNASLHSSNDSGFSNEPPPQPEIDYSDEEGVNRIPIRSSRSEKSLTSMNKRERINLSHNDINENDEIYGTVPTPNTNRNNMRQATSYSNLTGENNNDKDYKYRTQERLNNNSLSTNTLDNTKMIKRTKSFWKFNNGSKENDLIIESMTLWKHHDLVPTEEERIEIEKKEATLKRNMRKKNRLNESKEIKLSTPPANVRPRSIAVMSERESDKFHLTKSEIDQRISKHNEETSTLTKNMKKSNSSSALATSTTSTLQKQPSQNERTKRKTNAQSEPLDDQIYGEAPVRRNHTEQIRSENYRKSTGNSNNNSKKKIDNKSRYQQQQQPKMNNYYNDNTLKSDMDDFSLMNHDDELMNLQDTNFYDDEESMQHCIMKTVKRKEILKQYYNSSGTDTERNSSSSDPYDCIVVDDHLVSAANMLIRNKENLNRNRKTDDDKMDFSTFRSEKKGNGNENEQIPLSGTLLPRTKLSKTSSAGPIMDTVMKFEAEQEQREQREQRDRNERKDRDRSERNERSEKGKKNHNNSPSKHQQQQQQPQNYGKAYGPWYDLWGQEAVMEK